MISFARPHQTHLWITVLPEMCSLALNGQSHSQPRAVGGVMLAPRTQPKKWWPLRTDASDQIWRKVFADVTEDLRGEFILGVGPKALVVRRREESRRRQCEHRREGSKAHTGQGRLPVTRRQKNQGTNLFSQSPREIGPMQPCSWLSIAQIYEGKCVVVLNHPGCGPLSQQFRTPMYLVWILPQPSSHYMKSHGCNGRGWPEGYDWHLVSVVSLEHKGTVLCVTTEDGIIRLEVRASNQGMAFYGSKQCRLGRMLGIEWLQGPITGDEQELPAAQIQRGQAWGQRNPAYNFVTTG